MFQAAIAKEFVAAGFNVHPKMKYRCARCGREMLVHDDKVARDNVEICSTCENEVTRVECIELPKKRLNVQLQFETTELEE